jgi:hypothetical protein
MDDRLKVTEATLVQSEAQYKKLLTEDPANPNIRMDLAWCLFIHALHEAGRGSAEVLMTDGGQREDNPDFVRQMNLPEDAADRLFKGSLHETFIIMHLDTSGSIRPEIARLHSLIRLCGGDKVLRQADHHASISMINLLRDINEGI